MGEQKTRTKVFRGRLRVALSLSSPNMFSLNVGSKETRFTKNVINLDLDVKSHPDIVADARHLPLKSDIFEQVFLTDVIEHLPNRHEYLALREIYRALKDKGILILSTPHNHAFYALLDVAKYVMIHKHYGKDEVHQLLKTSGFRVLKIFASGGVWAFINTLWYSFVTYPLKKFFATRLQYVPSVMGYLEDKEYNYLRENGYTIFVKSIKKE